MTRKRRYLLLFLFIMGIEYLHICGGYAAVWAGFNGFGVIPMEYSETGQRMVMVIFIFPALFLFLLLAWMIIKNGKQKAAVKYYVFDVCTWLLGIGAGIFLFYMFEEPRIMIMDSMTRFIKAAGWLEYPVP
ncbi:MAG: hypothetical protein K2P19_05320 [Kineothrix sp.]|nr:hypothetical protein [Kineothrix sp.]NBI92362.1 hypothetical protein [Lachnospiraceae bacterium]